MTLKKLLNLQKLKLAVKNFAKDNKLIEDIIIYGSLVRGKTETRDIDFAILLKEKTNVGKKLKLAQELRHKLKKILNYDIDVKTIDIHDLTDPGFMARQGIIGEGYLLLRKKSIAELFGFKTYTIFIYNLKGLNCSEKTMFRYALNGRRGQKGVLEIMEGKHLGGGVIEVPVEHSEEFKEFLEKHKIEHKIQKALIY